MPRSAVRVSSVSLLSASLLLASPGSAPGQEHDLLVTGMRSHNMVRVNGVTGEATEIVRSASGGLNKAHSIQIGPEGDWYIAGYGTGAVLRYEGGTGRFKEVFVGPGEGGLDTPTSCRIGPDGLFYVASYHTNEMLRFDDNGEFVDVFVTARSGGLNGPEFPYWPGDGHMYLIDGRGDRILRYDEQTGDFVDEFIDGSESNIHHMHTIIWRNDGTVLVDGFGSGQVQRFDAETGEFIEVFIAAGTGGLNQPHGMEVGPDDGLLYVGSAGSDAILRFDIDTGELIDEFCAPGAGVLDMPTDLQFIPRIVLDLEAPVPGEAGRVNGLDVSGATPGEEIWLVYGDVGNDRIDIPGCLGLQGDIAQPRFAARQVADADGTARFLTDVPEQAAGREVRLQAVDLAGCRVSDPIDVVFD